MIVSTRLRHAGVAPLALMLLALSSVAGPAQDLQKFDGRWATTVTCKVAKDAGTATVQFVSEVRDGVLTGQQGTDGAPGFLRIDGKITAAGVGHVYARGRSGKNEVVAGREIPAGTEYSYYIQARFEGKSGSGNRVEGRPCAFKFDKK